MIRKHFRALLTEEADLERAVNADRITLEKAIRADKCWTVALYKHGRMLFLYAEMVDENMAPADIFPEVTKLLVDWVQKEEMVRWKQMDYIFYHTMPEDRESWARHGKKTRRGRIAYLLPDKLFSYVYYHKALVDEGLLEGDMYQSIALHEDVLFSYFEEPKIFTHIKKEVNEPSKIINDWLAVDPESHFDHELAGELNFRFIDEVISLGVEDLQ